MTDASPPGPTIRHAGPDDLPIIVEFNRRLAIETESKVLDPSILEAGVAAALADPDRLRYWLAECDGMPHPVGQAAVTREWSDWRNGWIWWFQSVYVDGPFRGRGIFRALLTDGSERRHGPPRCHRPPALRRGRQRPRTRDLPRPRHESGRLFRLRGIVDRRGS